MRARAGSSVLAAVLARALLRVCCQGQQKAMLDTGPRLSRGTLATQYLFSDAHGTSRSRATQAKHRGLCVAAGPPVAAPVARASLRAACHGMSCRPWRPLCRCRSGAGLCSPSLRRRPGIGAGAHAGAVRSSAVRVRERRTYGARLAPRGTSVAAGPGIVRACVLGILGRRCHGGCTDGSIAHCRQLRNSWVDRALRRGKSMRRRVPERHSSRPHREGDVGPTGAPALKETARRA